MDDIRTNEPMNACIYALSSKNNKCHAHWRAWNYVYAIKMNKLAKTPWCWCWCEPKLNGPSEAYADRLRRPWTNVFCFRSLVRSFVRSFVGLWMMTTMTVRPVFHKALMEIQRKNKQTKSATKTKKPESALKCSSNHTHTFMAAWHRCWWRWDDINMFSHCKNTYYTHSIYLAV